DPPALAARSRDGEIAAELDEHGGAVTGTEGARRKVGGPRLRRGAQIELGTQRDGQQPGVAIDADVLPSRAGEAWRDGRTVRGHVRDVAVVAELAHAPADGGVDESVGVARGVECGADELHQDAGDRGGTTGARVRDRERGVGAKPA